MAKDRRLADGPLYRPYRWAGVDFQLGLRAIDPRQWILIDPDHARLMAEKRALLTASLPSYYRTLPSSLAAQHELRTRVVDHLLTDHADCFERTGPVLRLRGGGGEWDLSDEAVEPLLQLSRIIQEDFMLIESVDGSSRITAASNAYSSSGRLVSSVGRDVNWAHEPVPALNSKLGSRLNRVIDSVHLAAPCERFNWQITPLSSVYFPPDNPHAANATAMHELRESLGENADLIGERLWIRVERQTLSRLPESRAVAFSLHTYSDPLSALRSDPESINAILALLRAYSQERWAYSEMDIVREPLIAWLEAAAEHGETAQ